MVGLYSNQTSKFKGRRVKANKSRAPALSKSKRKLFPAHPKVFESVSNENVRKFSRTQKRARKDEDASECDFFR